MHRRTLAKLSLAAPALFLARPAFAKEPENYQEGGVAIDGSDTVGYFTQNGPVAGDASFTVDYKGATWRFADQGSADAFAATPAPYEPQIGGYCAWAVSQGNTAPGDAERWAIVDGKLYLNYNKSIQKKWDADRAGFIEQADAEWPTVLQ